MTHTKNLSLFQSNKPKSLLMKQELKFTSQTPVEWLAFCVLSHSVVSDSLATPWTVACQAPLSMGFPRQEYRSGLPFASPGHLPDPGIKPTSLAFPVLAGWFFTTSTPRELCGCPWVDIKGAPWGVFSVTKFALKCFLLSQSIICYRLNVWVLPKTLGPALQFSSTCELPSPLACNRDDQAQIARYHLGTEFVSGWWECGV